MTDADLSKLKFDKNGLIPAIVQDIRNGQVLMMAWMNRESLEKTVRIGLTHFYSRSRKKLWQKGETSGHVQKVKEILVDCDADCLLVKVDQVVAACHTGHRSCFFSSLEGETKGNPVFDPESVYSRKDPSEIVERLYEIILDRQKNPRKDSYTSSLLSGKGDMLGKKVVEETRELVEAAAKECPKDVIHEAADLVYHFLVLLAGAAVTPDQVREELLARFGTGGLKEKSNRK